LSFADLLRENIDFAIRFGQKPGNLYTVEEIAEEYLVPAISPALAGDIQSPLDLGRFDLIHDPSLQFFEEGAPNWETWFNTVGLEYDTEKYGMSFSQSDHAVQAAASGAGVALVRVILAGPEFMSGQIIVPFGPALPTGLKYYLLSQRPQPQTEEQGGVKDWLNDSISGRFQDITRKVIEIGFDTIDTERSTRLFRTSSY